MSTFILNNFTTFATTKHALFVNANYSQVQHDSHSFTCKPEYTMKHHTTVFTTHTLTVKNCPKILAE